MAADLRLAVAGLTDVGSVRDHNEDAWICTAGGRLLVVADGMGGHRAGEVAAELAIDVLTELFTLDEAPRPWWLLWRPPPQGAARLADALRRANRAVFDAARLSPEHHGMGTTVVALWMADGAVHHAHVGDSRLYRLRGDTLEQLTEDHSLLNKYRRAGLVGDEDVERFPYKNVIVRALGLWPSTTVDAGSGPAEVGDRYLLCSDGLTDMIDTPTIQRLMGLDAPPDQVARGLVDAALEAGGLDNVTAVVAHVESEDP